ncbi:MAG: hypothetical protein STSR0008_25400 [Ignavibacterium sp.]
MVANWFLYFVDVNIVHTQFNYQRLQNIYLIDDQKIRNVLSLIPKKFPIISDGYRILILSKGEGIKFGKKFWPDFILLEKKMFQNIIWK